VLLLNLIGSRVSGAIDRGAIHMNPNTHVHSSHFGVER
jgi:hypothetical protein